MRRPEFIARQSGHPRGWLGRIIARIMSVETSAENRAVLDLLELQSTDRLLEVGFGHGHALWEAAEKVTDGMAVGVDVSEDMVRMARRRRGFAQKSARLQFHLTDGVHLPFADRSFDKAFSVHTIYFWKQPEATLSEIARVMTPGGIVVLAFRTKDDRAAEFFPESVYRFYSAEDVRGLLGAAGFECTREGNVHRSGSALALVQARKVDDRPEVPE